MERKFPLKKILLSERYGRSLRRWAETLSIDVSQLSRILSGERALTPPLVGQIAAHLVRRDAKILISAYLATIAAEIIAERDKCAAALAKLKP